MKLYCEGKNYKLYNGSMLDMLDYISKESIDSIITDPPYELNFMNKGWDNAGISFQPDTWKKCYEVLKPGGYLLAFGGSRTFHRIACAIEDAGFEIRDTIMWLYGSGFPKSMNIAKGIEGKLINGSANTKDFKKLNGEQIERGNWGIAKMQKEQGYRNKDYDTEAESSTYLGKLQPTTDLAKQYQGWGSCLKPSFEPIIVARKPFKGSLVDNVIEYGVGGINIDECRVYTNEKMNYSSSKVKGVTIFGTGTTEQNQNGRFPANTILTYDETDYDEVCGGFPNTKSAKNGIRQSDSENVNCYGKGIGIKAGMNNGEYGDSGSASRYFYCAKASKKDRDEGLKDFEEKRKLGYGYANKIEPTSRTNEGMFKDRETQRKNTHPTVKPTELMQYLIRLVSPNGSTILDPFNGSGSTGKAVMYENKERNKNYKYIGIELTEEYLPISKARIEYVCNLEPEKDNQTNIYDFIKD